MWQRLFGRTEDKPEEDTNPYSGYDFDIVGESFYQDNLEKICGAKIPDGHEHRCKATFRPEPENKFDKNAIAVLIDDLQVGYIPKNATASFAKALKQEALVVDALIIGGWKRSNRDQGHFGVKLRIG